MQADSGSAPWPGQYVNATAVQPRNLPRQVKTKTGAAGTRPQAIKRFEHVFMLFLGNTRSFIANLNATRLVHEYGDCSRPVAMFDGIADKVGHGLFDLQGIDLCADAFGCRFE